MKKAPLYSRSRPPARIDDTPPPGAMLARDGANDAGAARPARAPTRRSRLRALLGRHERKLWAAGVLLLAAAIALRGPLAPHTP
ncbi:MAG: hypothetical protein KGK18_12235, partial [Burkholderiales bacterium]|nr:hypothetical protein [Burkholderiales bacterium]